MKQAKVIKLDREDLAQITLQATREGTNAQHYIEALCAKEAQRISKLK